MRLKGGIGGQMNMCTAEQAGVVMPTRKQEWLLRRQLKNRKCRDAQAVLKRPVDLRPRLKKNP